jgi:hypothetical protein
MFKYRTTMMAIALAAFSVGSACAQSAGGGGGNTQSNTTFQEWLNMKSSSNMKTMKSDRISRQEYMDEASHRWDMMDKNKQGLTASEIHHMYMGPAAVMGGPTSTTVPKKKGITQ